MKKLEFDRYLDELETYQEESILSAKDKIINDLIHLAISITRDSKTKKPLNKVDYDIEKLVQTIKEEVNYLFTTKDIFKRKLTQTEFIQKELMLLEAVATGDYYLFYYEDRDNIKFLYNKGAELFDENNPTKIGKIIYPINRKKFRKDMINIVLEYLDNVEDIFTETVKEFASYFSKEALITVDNLSDMQKQVDEMGLKIVIQSANNIESLLVPEIRLFIDSVDDLSHELFDKIDYEDRVFFVKETNSYYLAVEWNPDKKKFQSNILETIEDDLTLGKKLL